MGFFLVMCFGFVLGYIVGCFRTWAKQGGV